MGYKVTLYEKITNIKSYELKYNHSKSEVYLYIKNLNNNNKNINHVIELDEIDYESSEIHIFSYCNYFFKKYKN